MENREGIIEFVKEAYPITKGKYRIPLAVTEFFIEKEKLKEIEEKLNAIFLRIKEIVFEFLDNSLKGYPIDEFRKNLYLKIYENYNYKFKGIIRFDMINFKLIEINADAVEGVIQLDITSKWFSELFDFVGEPRYNREPFLSLFDKPAIIVYPDNYLFVDEYYLESKLLKGPYIKESEFYENKKYRIYPIYRRAIDIDKVKKLDYWLEKQNINDILFTIMGNKANLAFLDKEVDWALDIVAKTSFKPEFKKYVCKPYFGTHGEVYFEKRDNCVYQEFIEIPKREISYLDIDDKIKKGIFYYDFNPYAFFDKKLRFGNILLRFSKDHILNVAKGGGVGFYTIV